MSAEPGFVVLSALMRVVVSVRTSFLRVIFLAYIISCMEQKKTLAFILTFIGISFLIVGVTYAVQSFFENRYQPVCQEKLVQSLQRELFEKMRTVDLQSYDTESYYSAITLAVEECSKKGSSGRRKFSEPVGICPDACPDLCFRDRGGLDCTGCGCCVVRVQLLDESKNGTQTGIV